MADIHNIQNNLLTHVQSPRQVQQTMQQSQYKGQTIALHHSTLSLVEMAKEELTFALADKIDKKLADRRLQAGGSKYTIDLSKFEQTLPKLSMHDKAFQRFAKALLASPFITSAQINRQISQTYKDPAMQYLVTALVIDEIERMLKSRDRRLLKLEKLKEELLKQMGHLFEKNEARIRASVNIAEISKSFSHLFNQSELGQAERFYSDTVLGYQGLAQAYEKIMSEVGSERFLEGVAFMLQALAHDFYAETSSIAKEKLQAIIKDMEQLKVLNSVHGQCLMAQERLVRSGYMDSSHEQTSFLAKVLELMDKSWLVAQDFLNLSSKYGLTSTTASIAFLREFREIIRLVPIRIYGNIQKRDKLLETSQEALDDLIEQEEAEEDGYYDS